DVHLDEVERAIGQRVPDGDYETIAGLLIAQTGELPEVGQVVSITLPLDPAELVSNEPNDHILEVEVLEVARHVPSQVRARLVVLEGAAPDDDAEPVEGGDHR
ncbi:MAG: transporter associated domain-containing protein, partial [Ornithinimicrobium sp.]